MRILLQAYSIVQADVSTFLQEMLSMFTTKTRISSSSVVATMIICVLTISSPSISSMNFVRGFQQSRLPSKFHNLFQNSRNRRMGYLGTSILDPSRHKIDKCKAASYGFLRQHIVSARYLATKDSSPHHDENERNQTKNSVNRNQKNSQNSRNQAKKKDWKVNNEIQSDDAADKLAAAFDELARKEGFTSSLSYMADDKTFEDDFEFVDQDDDEGDEDYGILDPNEFDISDFSEFDGDDYERDIPGSETSMKRVEAYDDDYIDLGGDTDDDDMEARIAAAKRDMDTGRITVPTELYDFADRASDVDLRKLGFERELNPFGHDETPRKEQFKLISNAMTCSACGSDFQCTDESKPGFLPRKSCAHAPAMISEISNIVVGTLAFELAEKFEIQTKISKIEELQQLKEKADSDEWSVEDEVDFLIQTSGGDGPVDSGGGISGPVIDVDQMAEELGLDLLEVASKKVICKRCHGLQNFGKVDISLRPGWTDEPTISQEKFRHLLQPISQKPAVIVALVDLFDFAGSVLRELDGIAGNNPVILAANKVDLLPNEMGRHRVENWVRRELEYIGVNSLANVGGAVRLISCKTGSGVFEMLQKARSLADEMDCDVYIVGAANAGKSTLINHILGYAGDKKAGKIRAGNRNALKGALTTSPLPGTTLKFIKVDLGDGKSLYDTPGLLVNGTFTQILTPEELKIVVPKR